MPAGACAAAALVCLAGATRAAFTAREHVIGFGNLRYFIDHFDHQVKPVKLFTTLLILMSLLSVSIH